MLTVCSAHCGLQYCRIVDMDSQKSRNPEPRGGFPESANGPSRGTSSSSVIDELNEFRRVQIISPIDGAGDSQEATKTRRLVPSAQPTRYVNTSVSAELAKPGGSPPSSLKGEVSQTPNPLTITLLNCDIPFDSIWHKELSLSFQRDVEWSKSYESSQLQNERPLEQLLADICSEFTRSTFHEDPWDPFIPRNPDKITMMWDMRCGVGAGRTTP